MWVTLEKKVTKSYCLFPKYEQNKCVSAVLREFFNLPLRRKIMTSLAYDHQKFKYFDPLVNKAELFSKVSGTAAFSFFHSGVLLLLLVALSKLHMKELRKMLLRCEGKCQTLPNCIKTRLLSAKKVRSIFVRLEKSTRGSWVYGLHRRALGSLVADWDDLVVDLSISSDENIHRLVSKVASLL